MNVGGQYVPIPFNFESIDRVFESDKAERLKTRCTELYGVDRQISIQELRCCTDIQIRELADYIYTHVFVGYTTKQWGISPEQVDPFVIGRVPIRTSYDDRYFKDRFQMMSADGYTNLFQAMLEHEDISLRLNCDAREYLKIVGENVLLDGEIFDGPVFYTGCLDELLDFRFGRLPYRSLHFVLEYHNREQVLPVVQVNFPECFSYTRISEFKHFEWGENANENYSSRNRICGFGFGSLLFRHGKRRVLRGHQ